MYNRFVNIVVTDALIFNHRWYELVRGILLSNFGKILVIPAVLWGYSEMYVWLTAIFVCASNVQAFRGKFIPILT